MPIHDVRNVYPRVCIHEVPTKRRRLCASVHQYGFLYRGKIFLNEYCKVNSVCTLYPSYSHPRYEESVLYYVHMDDIYPMAYILFEVEIVPQPMKDSCAPP